MNKLKDGIIGIITIVIILVGFYLLALAGSNQSTFSTDEDKEFSVPAVDGPNVNA